MRSRSACFVTSGRQWSRRSSDGTRRHSHRQNCPRMASPCAPKLRTSLTVSQFAAEIMPARLSPSQAESTMVRLTLRQRSALGDAIRKLANYAAAALVFGQFVSERSVSGWLILAGVMLWIAFVGASLLVEENSRGKCAPDARRNRTGRLDCRTPRLVWPPEGSPVAQPRRLTTDQRSERFERPERSGDQICAMFG
jgi:hypothetical protein